MTPDCPFLDVIWFLLGGVGVGAGFAVVIHKVRHHNKER